MASGQPPSDASRREFFEFSLQFDDPAFIRRARSVEQGWDELVRTIERKQLELLEVTLVRLGILAALIDEEWQRLKVITEPEAIERLAGWQKRWRPELRSEVVSTRSRPRWKRAAKELNVSLEHFNRHWTPFIEALDLSGLNQTREDYNRFYVIEKSCAFQSEAIGRLDFKQLSAITHAELLQLYPPLELVPVR